MQNTTDNCVDLGAGKDPVENCMTVDYSEHNDPDIVWNLEDTPWKPLDDNQFTEVHMRHVLEHLRNWKDALREVDRITAPGGTVHIRVPHCSQSIRWPDHNNHFTLQSFDQLFDPDHSMYLGTDLEIVDRDLLWTTQKRTARGRLRKLMNPVVNGRLRPYFDTQLWTFIGGIQEVYVKLQKPAPQTGGKGQ